MISGYKSFGKDVQSIFRDVISRYNMHTVSIEFDAVVLENDKVEIVFTIIEEDLNMSIKSEGRYYPVTEMARLIEPTFYNEWEAKRQAAVLGLSRESYFKTYLLSYKKLSDRMLNDVYLTGELPMAEANREFAEKKKREDERYSRAWKAVQQLPYEHPVRQKYILDDPTWVSDMIDQLGQR